MARLCGCVGVGDQPQRVDLAAIQDAAADAPTPHTAALQDTVRWQTHFSPGEGGGFHRKSESRYLDSYKRMDFLK